MVIVQRNLPLSCRERSASCLQTESAIHRRREKRRTLRLEAQGGKQPNSAGKQNSLSGFQALARSGHTNDTQQPLVPASCLTIQKGHVKTNEIRFPAPALP